MVIAKSPPRQWRDRFGIAILTKDAKHVTVQVAGESSQGVYDQKRLKLLDLTKESVPLSTFEFPEATLVRSAFTAAELMRNGMAKDSASIVIGYIAYDGSTPIASGDSLVFRKDSSGTPAACLAVQDGFAVLLVRTRHAEARGWHACRPTDCLSGATKGSIVKTGTATKENFKNVSVVVLSEEDLIPDGKASPASAITESLRRVAVGTSLAFEVLDGGALGVQARLVAKSHVSGRVVLSLSPPDAARLLAFGTALKQIEGCTGLYIVESSTLPPLSTSLIQDTFLRGMLVGRS